MQPLLFVQAGSAALRIITLIRNHKKTGAWAPVFAHYISITEKR